MIIILDKNISNSPEIHQAKMRFLGKIWSNFYLDLFVPGVRFWYVLLELTVVAKAVWKIRFCLPPSEVANAKGFVRKIC